MDTPAPQPPSSPPPVPEEDPEVIAARVKRRLLMGAALVLAMTSIYGGVLGAPRLFQVLLAAIAAACVYLAFRSGGG
jgi:hypothetical protein